MSQSRENMATPNTSEPETRNLKPAARCTRPSKRSESKAKAQARESALKRLEIDLEELANVPKLDRILLLGCGSFKNAIAILEGDDSEDARAMVNTWRAITPEDRKLLPPEAIIMAARLSSRRFIEVLTGAIMQQSQDATRMMVAAAQPEVSKIMIRRATKRIPIRDAGGNIIGYEEGDFRAQELFHKITGMLPIPKGSQTIIQMGQISGGPQVHQIEESDEPKELQTMDEMLMDMQDVIRPQLQAPKETNSQLPVNAPEVEYLDI